MYYSDYEGDGGELHYRLRKQRPDLKFQGGPYFSKLSVRADQNFQRKFPSGTKFFRTKIPVTVLAFHVHHVPNMYWVVDTLHVISNCGQHGHCLADMYLYPLCTISCTAFLTHDLTNCFTIHGHIWKVTLSLLDHCTVVLSITFVLLYNWDWCILQSMWPSSCAAAYHLQRPHLKDARSRHMTDSKFIIEVYIH